MTPTRRALWFLRIVVSFALLATGLILWHLTLSILELPNAQADPLVGIWGGYFVTAAIFGKVAFGGKG